MPELPEKSFPTSIRLKLSLKESLKKHAVSRRWKLSWLIEKILEDWEMAERKVRKKRGIQ